MPTPSPSLEQSPFQRWKERRKKNASRGHIKRILLWILTLGGSGILIGALTLTLLLAWYSRDLPNPNTLMEREVPQSTKIFDRTGSTLLYEIHGEEKRTLVALNEIPDTMKWATIAVEDKTFYEHHGINFKRLIKAVIVDVIQRRKAQGASTLTQQFVKNAILTNEKSFNRKLKEIILSLQIERLYSKEQILQLYLNEIPYGSTLYGIEAASENFFGKKAKDLTLDESALLAALPQATDYYSPYGTGLRGDHRTDLVERQHLILNLMVEQKYITAAQAEEAKKIDTLKKILPKSVGNTKAPHFVDYIKSQLKDTYGQRMMEQGGLRVITTLDWSLQQAGEEEVKNGVEARGKKYGFNNSALVALDAQTGQVLAMVGSKDFNDPHDGQVNVVLSPRQPGSSFKPIVYAAGFIKGYTPSMTLWDVNTTFKTDLKDYAPKNYDLKENGPVSARKALQGSLNIPAVKMLYLVGIGRVLDFAEQLGYTTLQDRSRFGLSLVLGGGEVKLIEHAHAYAAFANDGKQQPLASILKVEDPSGKVLEEWKPSDGKQIVDPQIARELSDVLSDNNARAYIFTTKNALTLPDRPVAAKTGTTNNYRDAWTMGYTPQLVTGVWVGNNDNTEMKHGADGSVVAAPIWQAFMKRATKALPIVKFITPEPASSTNPLLQGLAGETKLAIDKVSGKLATSSTPPEFIEQRTYHAAHNELWYIDKDDPAGPMPTDPANDPQFSNWEAGVQDWAKRNNWLTSTSTPPTETDDVHTIQNQPQVILLNPTPNTTINTRDPLIQVSVAAQRIVRRFEVSIDGTLTGAALGNILNFNTHIPNSIGIGFHDLVVTAIDDVGNRGSASTTINLTADNAPLSATLTSPPNNSTYTKESFPVTLIASISDLTDVTKVDIFQEESLTGDTHLLASEISPQQSVLSVNWNTAPPPGTYYLYAVVTTKDKLLHPGPKVTVKME